MTEKTSLEGLARKRQNPLSKRHAQAAINLKRIWLIRKRELGLTQEEAADLLGFSTQGAVSHYLNGRMALNTEAILKFAKLLEVAPTDIDPQFEYSTILATPPIITDARGRTAEALAMLNDAIKNHDWTDHDSDVLMTLVKAAMARSDLESASTFPELPHHRGTGRESFVDDRYQNYDEPSHDSQYRLPPHSRRELREGRGSRREVQYMSDVGSDRHLPSSIHDKASPSYEISSGPGSYSGKESFAIGGDPRMDDSSMGSRRRGGFRESPRDMDPPPDRSALSRTGARRSMVSPNDEPRSRTRKQKLVRETREDSDIIQKTIKRMPPKVAKRSTHSVVSQQESASKRSRKAKS